VRTFEERIYASSIADALSLYEWQENNSEITITPEAEADYLDIKKLSKSEREFRESLADPDVQSSLEALQNKNFN
jgi:hypothetical protein